MVFRRLPVLFFLSLLIALPGNAQSRREIFSIGGSVRDAVDHHAMDNTQLTLRSPRGETVKDAFTRGDGNFQFDGLRNGEYILEINVKDYDLYTERISISGASHMGLSISLNRVGKAASATSQMSISAHQLSVPHKAYEEFEKGLSLVYLKSDYRGAINQFQLAIRDFPTYYEAYAEEGAAYQALQEMGPAEEALRKSVELSSGQYAEALFNLAALLTDTKRYPEAETVARKAILDDKSSWRGQFELARALIALKQPDEAEKNAQEARDIMPDNSPVYLLLANIHIQKKDYPALIRDLDEFLRLAPNSPEAEQARKTRERVQGFLNAPKTETGDGADEKSQDDEDEENTDTEKSSAPDTRDAPGLPSLPPPTK
ncbi:MAG TPA: tetratricopeptide repeat protein [Candidatus Saccharimonadales bacterium]|jgi:tetratricopeptide (TPR) repeat protein|nr:tetratricopeptide repeat protein [Candidatus Saccharimonadales bacterium]